MSILTKNQNGVYAVKLFDDGIVIDQTLPKWVNASKRISEKKGKKDAPVSSGEVRVRTYQYQSHETYYDAGTNSATNNFGSPFIIYEIPEAYGIDKKKVNFDEIAAADLQELTEIIKNGELNNVLSGYGGMHPSNSMHINSGDIGVGVSKTKTGLFGKIMEKFNAFRNKPEFDAVTFFTNVKLTSKGSAEDYRDRVAKYLRAIHNAKAVGQTALVEKLLSEMIANKYESLLFSNGVYHVVTEEQLVNFAKKTEKGIDLCYVKNYTRPIPTDVIEKIGEANELEVYDNFVVLHYDPNGLNKKETRKEEAKRKDPIVFGVIAGSNKLYYVADWVDEHCNLTLEKFVDTIGLRKQDLYQGRGSEDLKRDTQSKEESGRHDEGLPKPATEKEEKVKKPRKKAEKK